MTTLYRDGHPMEVHAAQVDADGLLYGGLHNNESRAILLDAAGNAEPILPLLGDKAKVIGWHETRKVRINRKNASLTFYTGEKKSSKKVSIDVGKDVDFRNRLFDAIQAQTGWAPSEKAHNPITAALAPGFWLALSGAFGWFLVDIARTQAAGGQTASPSGRARLLYSLADLLGPTGSMIASGLVFVLVLIWFLRRVANPPVFVTLKP